MLETIKSNTQKLIALYEAEKSERVGLQKALEESRMQADAYRKQIEELKQEADNLKLSGAFTGSSLNGAQAKKRIDGLIAEIDKCITLLEG